MAQFITKTNNKFENKTTTEGMPCQLERKGKIRWIFDLRQISTPDMDSLVVDIHHFSPDWFFLRNGKLYFNIDGKKNIILDANESYTDVGREQGSFDREATVVTEEDCYYKLTKDELKEICDAQHLEIQVTGDAIKKQMDGELFRLYARAFYNYVFDSSEYKGAIQLFLNKYKSVKREEWTDRDWKLFGIISVIVVVILLIAMSLE